MKKRLGSLLLALCLALTLLPGTALAASVTEVESNDSIPTAQPVGANDTISGEITEKDYDYFAITVPESGTLTLKITSYLQIYCMAMYDQLGSQFYYKDNRVWNQASGIRMDEDKFYLEPGTYYLQIKGSRYLNWDPEYTGSYQIVLSFEGAGATEKEPNDTIATADQAVIGKKINGFISVYGNHYDIDFYRFDLAEPGKLSMQVTFFMACNTVVLYDANGSKVWTDDQNRVNSAVGFLTQDHVVYLDAGTYYLAVMGSVYSNWTSDCPGKYSIETSFEPANSQEVEPNNDMLKNATPVALGTKFNGMIAENGDLDYFAFTLDKSGKISLDITFQIPRLQCTIYDSDAKAVLDRKSTNWNSTTGYGTYSSGEISLEAGTYYLLLNGDGSSNVGFYTVTLGSDEAALPAAYTVTFLSNGGTGTMPKQVAVAAANGIANFTLPACKFTAPSGMQFDHWEYNGKSGKVNERITLQNDVTIKAVWKAKTPAPSGPSSGFTFQFGFDKMVFNPATGVATIPVKVLMNGLLVTTIDITIKLNIR